MIKPAKGKGGVLEFGTTVLSAADGSIAGLLGASPGASTAVPAMLDVMERCFNDRYTASWQPKLKEMIPSLGARLSDEPGLFDEVWAWGAQGDSRLRRGRARRRLPTAVDACVTVALRRVWAPDLDAATLYELLKLRVEVFVVEQACPYPELDGRDLLAETRHYWLEQADGEVICTLRLMEEHSGGAQGLPHRPGVHQAHRPRPGAYHATAAGRAGRGGRLPVPHQRADLPGRDVRQARVRPRR